MGESEALYSDPFDSSSGGYKPGDVLLQCYRCPKGTVCKEDGKSTQIKLKLQEGYLLLQLFLIHCLEK